MDFKRNMSLVLHRYPLNLFCLIVLSGCRLERRDDFDFSPDAPLRCGIFRSYYFVREVQEEVYPDLGLVLANTRSLQLSQSQVVRLENAARECVEICEVKKNHLRLMQEEIKAKLALNEIKGDLKLLAKDVRAFENSKAEWLQGHAARYHSGLNILTEAQRARWKQAESYLRAFPRSATER